MIKQTTSRLGPGDDPIVAAIAKHLMDRPEGEALRFVQVRPCTSSEEGRLVVTHDGAIPMQLWRHMRGRIVSHSVDVDSYDGGAHGTDAGHVHASRGSTGGARKLHGAAGA